MSLPYPQNRDGVPARGGRLGLGGGFGWMLRRGAGVAGSEEAQPGTRNLRSQGSAPSRGRLLVAPDLETSMGRGAPESPQEMESSGEGQPCGVPAPVRATVSLWRRRKS